MQNRRIDGDRAGQPRGEDRRLLHARARRRRSASPWRPAARSPTACSQEIGRYEFWKFDLAERKLAGRTEFKGRPRMSLKTSSNGKVLYIYNAGNTIDLYDAATYQVPARPSRSTAT